MTRFLLALCGLFLFSCLGVNTMADAPASDPAEAKKVLEDWLAAQTKGAAPDPLPVDSAALHGLFPETSFFTVSVRMFPVARMAPEPLKNQNIFAVTGKDVLHITDIKGLEDFFKKNLPATDADEKMKAAAEAWAALTSEFSADGFYKFDPQPPTIKGKAASVEVKVAPVNGDKGSIVATLSFEGGKLTGVSEKRDIKPGMRPICQATKLLDSDPIVRRMARQDILVMGHLCRPYLDEQRAIATPELQAAIDEVWEQIVREER